MELQAAAVSPARVGPSERTPGNTAVTAAGAAVGSEAEAHCPSRQQWIQSSQANALFGGCILLNAMVLGIETDHRPDATYALSQPTWFAIDTCFTVVFLIEVILRMRADRAMWCCDSWNVFDALLVLIGIVDVWIFGFLGAGSNFRIITIARIFRLLRLTRILRVLRLFRFLHELLVIMRAILGAVVAMAWSLLLIGVVLLISAMFTTRLVGHACCSEEDSFTDPQFKVWFGTVPRTLLTLFQFVTLENWPNIAREAFDQSPLLVLFIIAFIMFTNIMLLNTVASIVVENVLFVAGQEELSRWREHDEQQKRRLRNLFDSMDTNQDGALSWAELQQRVKPRELRTCSSRMNFLSSRMSRSTQPEVGTVLEETLRHLNISELDARELFHMLDTDGSGNISKEEFVESLMDSCVPPTAMNLLQLSTRINRAGSRLQTTACHLRKLDQRLVALGERLRSGPPESQAGFGGLPAAVLPAGQGMGAVATELFLLRREMLEAMSATDARLTAQLQVALFGGGATCASGFAAVFCPQLPGSSWPAGGATPSTAGGREQQRPEEAFPAPFRLMSLHGTDTVCHL